jgi:hypothetical protein
MNRLSALAEPRAVPFQAVTFYPYRVTESGRTYPLIVSCNSLKEAVEGAKVSCQHKEHLLIKEVGPTGQRLHLFAIRRKSNPRYVWQGHEQKRVHDLYAAEVCSFDGGVVG